MSDTTPLNSERRTVASGLSERPTSYPVHRTSGRHGADGIMQRLGVVDQVREGPSLSSASASNSVSTIGNESWHTTETTFQDPTNSNHSSEPADNRSDLPESRVAVPRISVQTDDSVPSDGPSFAVINSSEYQHPTPADLGTSRGASNMGSSSRVDDARIGRRIHDAKKPGPLGQQPSRHSRPARAHDHSPQPFPPLNAGRDPAAPDPKPRGEEPNPSRNSSLGRKGEPTVMTYDRVSRPI